MGNNSDIVRDLFDAISDEYFAKATEKRSPRAVVEQPSSVLHPDFMQLVESAVGQWEGRRMCVVGSGDNYASLAFAALGASVTALDVSERQIDNAREVSRSAGVDIAYVCADAMDMPEALDESFDVVVSTNGFLPFVSDLGALFAGVERILVAGGSYLLFDTHPFIYPFAGYVDKVAVKKPYEATGPFAKGATYHWRVQDIVNSVVSSGLVLSALLELHALPGTFWDDLVDDEDKLQHAHDWRYNGLAALPQWIVVKAEKRREPCASHTFFDSANPESPSGFGSICERDDNE